MLDFNSLFLTDGYKTGHHIMYPTGTEYVYSNFTPRSDKHAPQSDGYLLNMGQQMLIKKIHNHFAVNFFKQKKEVVCGEMKRELSMYLDCDYDVTHFEQLHDTGYLPIEVKALEEGTLVPMRVPTLTIANTKPINGHVFAWITNYLETILSSEGWITPTSATQALAYRRILHKACMKTHPEAIDFVKFQGHDFSMRGMSISASINSGIGHASCFYGSDTLPVIPTARKYYNAEGMVICSVNATEHSVMCAGGMEDEVETFRTLMKKFPTGILSIVSDTWDLTKVLHPTKGILVQLKDEILARDGKIVIRPDSGDPVEIVCGHNRTELTDREKEAFWPEFYNRGVVGALWDIFGGTASSTNHSVLNEKVGCIYGDSITTKRCQAMVDQLAEKGFASTNCIFGIGSFTYQYVTRDTYGFAMKATFCRVNGEDRNIYKDPITDSGIKKSAKGLLAVTQDEKGDYMLHNEVDVETEQNCNMLAVIYRDGKFENETTLMEIRAKVDKLIEQ